MKLTEERMVASQRAASGAFRDLSPRQSLLVTRAARKLGITVQQFIEKYIAMIPTDAELAAKGADTRALRWRL